MGSRWLTPLRLSILLVAPRREGDALHDLAQIAGNAQLSAAGGPGFLLR